MTKGVNKVIIIGNLGADPKVTHLPSGTCVANVSIATSDTRKDKTGGEAKEHTEWHNVVFFNRTAEIAGEYLKKGSRIYIEGKLQTRKWQDKEGKDCYRTEILANSMQMLDSKSDGNSNGNFSKSSNTQKTLNEVKKFDDIPF